jgi:KDO2-lipid IV(A) lauroyltransferase
VQGQFVPFFGRPAFTPRAASDLAVRTRAPVLFGCVHRVEPTRHRIVLRRIELPEEGDRERGSLALTAALTREIEAQIRLAPHEWVWMHRRWQTQPGAEGEAPKAPDERPPAENVPLS